MGVDILSLLPEKFRSELLTQYITVFEEFVDDWHSDINGLKTLIDPYNCPVEYLKFLSKQVGWTLLIDANTTDKEKRDQLLNVIDFYKSKGTYQAIERAAFISGLTLDIYDLYTSDYSTFSKQDWFIGESDSDNPSGLNSTYYKSPHFGLEIKLDTVYTDATPNYLWGDSKYTNFSARVERIRPINTVPRYTIALFPVTDNDGSLKTESGQIKTITFGTWAGANYLFDATDSTDMFDFDDGAFQFDYTNSSILNSVTKYKLGTGNVGETPGDSGALDLETVVLSGSIETTTIGTESVTYEFTIPKATVQSGITELGLYENDNTTLRVLSLFPEINKSADVELRILVTVNFV